MHELSIAMSILDVATEEVRRRGIARVTAVHVAVGQLAGVVPEALRSAFDLAREHTPLAAAELVIEEVPVAVVCPACAAERAVHYPELRCSVCDSPTPHVIRGRELDVVAIETEP